MTAAMPRLHCRILAHGWLGVALAGLLTAVLAAPLMYLWLHVLAVMVCR